MRALFRAFAVVALLSSTTAGADVGARHPHPGLPRADERLAKPIVLATCPGVRIVEWRPSPAAVDATSPSPMAIAFLEMLCAAAGDEFTKFVKERFGIDAPAPRLELEVSVLPANQRLDGALPRALNDA